MGCDWLITGAGGQFGGVLHRLLLDRGESAIGLTSPSGPRPVGSATRPVDLCDPVAIGALVRALRPRIIIHAAAVTSIQKAYDEPVEARRVNVEATAHLAELATEVGARLAFTSTDLVFDGGAAPYDERAEPRPTSIYAKTKLDAEGIVLAGDRGLVIRLALMYGLPEVPRRTTFTGQLSAIERGEPLRLFEDEFRSPIWLQDAATSTMDAAQSQETGILHVGGPRRMSRLDMGRIAAVALGRPTDNLVATRQADFDAPEPRPRDVSLDSGLFYRRFDHPAGRGMEEAMILISDEYRRRGGPWPIRLA